MTIITPEKKPSLIPAAPAKLLEGKRGLIVGIANDQSIAWGCAKAFRALGCELAVTYINQKTRTYVEPLARELEAPILMPLDVRVPGQMEAVFERIAGAASISWCTRSRSRRKKRCRAASRTWSERASSPPWKCPAGASSAWRISPSR